MATYTASEAVHKTLGAATVDTVRLTKRVSRVEVVNRDTAEVLYVTFNGTNPTVAGDNTRVIPAGMAFEWPAPTDTIKLISSGAALYSVQGVP